MNKEQVARKLIRIKALKDAYREIKTRDNIDLFSWNRH